MLEKPIFVLGVGAQKAGSSWLHGLLHNHPQSKMGFAKEYHVWDAVFSEHCRRFLVDQSATKTGFKPLARYAMQNFDGYYERWFRELVGTTARITGDITPSYCLLNSRQFRNIRSRLVSEGFLVKVVFIVRDPVARCWSAARMEARERGKKGDVLSEHQVNELFRSLYSSADYALRTKYEATLWSLYDAFSEGEIHIEIFERFFGSGETQPLEDFLGIQVPREILDSRTNVSPKMSLDQDLAHRCFDFYSETYRECWRQIPDTRALWRKE